MPSFQGGPKDLRTKPEPEGDGVRPWVALRIRSIGQRDQQRGRTDDDVHRPAPHQGQRRVLGRLNPAGTSLKPRVRRGREIDK